jgi:hypothetical protein
VGAQGWRGGTGPRERPRGRGAGVGSSEDAWAYSKQAGQGPTLPSPPVQMTAGPMHTLALHTAIGSCMLSPN